MSAFGRATQRRMSVGFEEEAPPAAKPSMKKRETWKTLQPDQSSSRIPTAAAAPAPMSSNVLASSTRTKKTNRGEKIQI